MKKQIDWSEYKFRASQCHKLLTGKIESSDTFLARINDLEHERDTLTNANGNKVKWTDNKQIELSGLVKKVNTPLFERLPKTLTSELRQIHRAETHGRNFSFTNKYVQKGIAQEEEAITVYQDYRTHVSGIRTLFINNKKRLFNEWVSGEADLTDTNDFANCNEGFDTKCSWELETFPFKGDELNPAYECQNQVYMWLSKTNKWTTASILVNTTEQLLHLEKQKWFFAMGMHTNDKTDEEQEKADLAYEEKAKELEVRFIFDYDKFTNRNPGHLMDHSRKEWMDNGYDLELKDKVIEKISLRNNPFIDNLKERIEISRKYLAYLDKK
tara:strand:+ start:4216 stop:5196 length:981 start_codon:yes stop_codon:yes gene_type:complete